MRSASGYVRGLSRTVLTTVKMAVLVPMPRARAAMAAMVKPGFLKRLRREYLRSFQRLPTDSLHDYVHRAFVYSLQIRHLLSAFLARPTVGCMIIGSLEVKTKWRTQLLMPARIY